VSGARRIGVRARERAQRAAGHLAVSAPRRLLASALALALLACSGGEESVSTTAEAGPPAAPHGAVMIEPPELFVGDLVTVDVTIVTPPDHRVRPVELAETVPALWLLDAERLPVRRAGGRWTHVTRVRARVRDVPGRYAWPAQPVEILGPDGEVERLTLEPRAFTVASTSDALPDRLEPFGLRTPGGATGRGGLAHALLGAALTLLALAAGLGARRWRARVRARRAAAPADLAPAWETAGAELDAALASVGDDPRAAADRAALALRRYVHRRTGRPVESLTTEEIAAQRAPGRLRSRWPELVALLTRLDALRFPGDLDHAEGATALRAALEDARCFVRDSIPPRELR